MFNQHYLIYGLIHCGTLLAGLLMARLLDTHTRRVHNIGEYIMSILGCLAGCMVLGVATFMVDAGQGGTKAASILLVGFLVMLLSITIGEPLRMLYKAVFRSGE